MSFEEWYEANKESLTVCSMHEALKKAWDDGWIEGFHYVKS